MSGKRRTPIPRDVLDVAREQLPGADPCAVFDRLFDAALRSVRHIDPRYPRKIDALNDAMDRLYLELKRDEPAKTECARTVEVDRARTPKQPDSHLTPGYR